MMHRISAVTAENHNVLGGFVADEQYVCVGQQGVVVDVFLEDNVPVVLKGISIGHSMGVVLVLG